jgi:EAL domain-containing protein (putative c-di-GMP-specific phosphodiesterase class I)
MASHDPAQEPRRWSGPIEKLGEDERRTLVNSMISEPRPRIEIDEALHQGWFEMWYQPKIDLKRNAGRRRGAGASGTRNTALLPATTSCPGAPTAARPPHRACAHRHAHQWTMFEEAGFNLHLAINVPVSVLLKLPIPALVDKHRPKSERWPGIILEVTEDQIVREMKAAQSVAEQLRASGIKIAIDDFGAGYSSFSSLRELPFVELKLDHSFVRNCATDATNAAICQTAVDLAHRFGSAAVAEGIENAADLQALLVMGCDFGQGVLIAPPMPQERFLDLLRQRMSKPRPQASAPEQIAPVAAGSIGQVA